MLEDRGESGGVNPGDSWPSVSGADVRGGLAWFSTLVDKATTSYTSNYASLISKIASRIA